MCDPVQILPGFEFPALILTPEPSCCCWRLGLMKAGGIPAEESDTTSQASVTREDASLRNEDVHSWHSSASTQGGQGQMYLSNGKLRERPWPRCFLCVWPLA